MYGFCDLSLDYSLPSFEVFSFGWGVIVYDELLITKYQRSSVKGEQSVWVIVIEERELTDLI